MQENTSTNESRLADLHEAGQIFRDALPSLKTTAWDAALSDHSVNYLAHADLTRYSGLYAFQRQFSQALWDMLRDSAVRDISNISLAIELGKADPTATIATLNSRMRTIDIMQSQIMQLDESLRAAEAASHAAEESSSGTSH